MDVTTDFFEISTLAYSLRSDDNYRKIIGFLNRWKFSSDLSSHIFEIVNEYFLKYDKIPNKDEIVYIYKSTRKVEDDTQIVRLLGVLLTFNINETFILDEINKYTKIRKLESLCKESYDKLKFGTDLDLSLFVNDIFSIQNEFVGGQKLFGTDISDAQSLIDQESNRSFIPTNIPELNNFLGGGLKSGSLGIVLAPPNYGKTMVLLNLAINAYLTGHNVLFVTLEMREYSIFKRLMWILSGALKCDITIGHISAISKKLNKKFHILYKPTGSITVEYLYSVYNQALASGVKFDTVLIDYADIIASSKSFKEKRHEYSEVFKSLKSMSQTLDIPIWSATQSNREGMKSGNVNMSSISEDFSKAHTSDVILALSEKLTVSSDFKLFITKNREGVSEVFANGYCNSNMWFEESAQSSVSLDRV